MRRSFLWVIISLFLVEGQVQHLQAAPKVPPAPPFTVGGLQFTIPPKWISEPVENSARAGQWLVPPAKGQGDDPGEVVVIYFGPGIGGTAQENIEDWIGTMVNAEGHPAAAEQKHHVTLGLTISQLAIFGTYTQCVPIPGVPPQPRPKFGLLGAVIEGKQGNIYWRFTGPETLIATNLPLFGKVIDSLLPVDK